MRSVARFILSAVRFGLAVVCVALALLLLIPLAILLVTAWALWPDALRVTDSEDKPLPASEVPAALATWASQQRRKLGARRRSERGRHAQCELHAARRLPELDAERPPELEREHLSFTVRERRHQRRKGADGGRQRRLGRHAGAGRERAGAVGQRGVQPRRVAVPGLRAAPAGGAADTRTRALDRCLPGRAGARDVPGLAPPGLARGGPPGRLLPRHASSPILARRGPPQRLMEAGGGLGPAFPRLRPLAGHAHRALPGAVDPPAARRAASARARMVSAARSASARRRVASCDRAAW